MLIDFITAYLHHDHIPKTVWDALFGQFDRIMKYSPSTGQIEWETGTWDSLRSDSHQISCKLSADALHIKGSPARVIGSGCALFGSGASSSLDLVGCVNAMASLVVSKLGVKLSTFPTLWTVTRIDVTQNIFLPSFHEVKSFLSVLRNCEGGRYRVSQQQGDSVYWSKNSKRKKGKAYHKGPHLRQAQRQRNYTGVQYSDSELMLSDRIARLELTIGSQTLRTLSEQSEKPWYKLTPEDLKKMWHDYFDRMTGTVNVNDDNELFEKILASAPTPGQARAAFGQWHLIKSQGWERSQLMTNRATWYRNLKILRSAGLGDADLSVGRVLDFRRKTVELSYVDCWQDVRRLAS